MIQNKRNTKAKQQQQPTSITAKTATTKQQQRIKSWHCLCIAHFWRCLSDRSWSFFLPLYLSKHCQSIKPTSIVTFVQNLSIVLGGTHIASYYSNAKQKSSKSSYRYFFTIGIIVENVCVALGGALVYYVVSREVQRGNPQTSLHGDDFCQQPLHSIPFNIGLICMAIDSIFSSFLGMMVSKEWVAILFTSHDKDEDNNADQHQQEQTQQLAHANATLAKIDLAVAALCPILISFVIEYYDGSSKEEKGNSNGYDIVVWLLISQHLVGAIWILRKIHQAWKLTPQLLYDTIAPVTGSSTSTNPSSSSPTNAPTAMDNDKSQPDQPQQQQLKEEEESRAKHSATMTSSSFSTLMNLPRKTQLVIMAYILLYFTVLSPGAMLNSWMNSLHSHHQTSTSSGEHGIVSERTIAIFGSSSQFCGAIATLITPQLIIRQQQQQRPTQTTSSSSPLYYAGMLAQWFQAMCVLVAFVCFYLLDNSKSNDSSSSSSWYLLHGFLIMIGLSRIGLWSFDLIERQILQKEDISSSLSPSWSDDNTNYDPTHPTSLNQGNAKANNYSDNDGNPSNTIRTILFNVEKGATQAVSLLMTFLCYVLSDRFDILVTLSTLAVTTSALLLFVAVRIQ
mmetsp:Transcript_7807/g.11215  ORF Transcript_7807/g.11215 Transcript_7807/m.11215 type:complete len:620 (+) Transcript_7807:55-1914(+)